jgi:hypothetical protein
MSKWRLCEAVHACSPGYSQWTREERLIGLAIIDFFSPDQRMRRCEPRINLDMNPKNDVGFFGAISGCHSPERIVTTLLLLALGCLATTRSKSVSLRVFGSFAKKVFDEFSLEAIDEKFFCAISKFEERARKQIHFKPVTLTTQPSDGLEST